MTKVTTRYAWAGVYESCSICKSPTQHWNLAHDVALCPNCAKTTPQEKVPLKSEWLRSQGVQLPPGWKSHAERDAGKKRAVRVSYREIEPKSVHELFAK